MSRSALTHQELMRANALRLQVQDINGNNVEERQVKQDELPIHGNEETYNINTLLHKNILQSHYYKQLANLKTFHEVVDEIYYRVDHAEPLSSGTSRVPSTCFCLLQKCCTMRLTRKQMQALLKHVDSPYIRVIGFLYLRYTCDPEDLWNWFEPFLEDTEEFNASTNPNNKTTIGKWLIGLLEENSYFSTILPRIPKKILDGIKVKLVLHRRKKEKEKLNLAIVPYLKKGVAIRALYSDEENAPAMYDAVIDSVEENYQYWVTFPEYGNTEKVGLGDIELKDKPLSRDCSQSRSISRHRSRSHSRSASRSRYKSNDRKRDDRKYHTKRRDDRDRDRSRSSSRKRHKHRDRSRSSSRKHHRGRSRSSSRPRRQSHNTSSTGLTEDLLAEVRESERRKAEAIGRDYAARPASYKGSLSMKLDRYTTRKRSRSPKKHTANIPRPTTMPSTTEPIESEPNQTKAPTEVSQEAIERMNKLRQLYGDASSSSKSK